MKKIDKTTQEFLAKFKILETKLRQIVGSSSELRFNDLLNRAESINYFIKLKRPKIINLFSLRNIFSHADGDKYIAKVNKIALDEIDDLIKVLSRPLSVKDVFKKDVYFVEVDEITHVVLQEMKRKTFTHVPVYKNGEFYGVFSESTLLYWLVDNLKEGKADFYKKQIKDINRKYLSSDSNNVIFIKEDTDIFEAYKIFHDAINAGGRLGALLITRDGSRDNNPSGIITAWDLPIINKYIN